MSDRAEAVGTTEGDPIEQDSAAAGERRQRFVLDDTGFDEVPKKYRRFYRKWDGPGDALGPNEALCPVCKIVIRSTRELRPGDRLYCMACMTRLNVVEGEGGRLEAHVVY
ncbi:MAG: hypothetical protein ACQGVK_08150 [Myxococcota bacterium]